MLVWKDYIRDLGVGLGSRYDVIPMYMLNTDAFRILVVVDQNVVPRVSKRFELVVPGDIPWACHREYVRAKQQYAIKTIEFSSTVSNG